MRFAIPIVVFLLLVVVFSFGLFNDPRELPSPFLGQQAPTFQAPSLKEPERTVGSADYAGKMALVNVWATWCVSCRVEHPYLNQLTQQGVPIYGVNYKDEDQDALRWLQELGNPYRLNIVDADGSLGLDLGVYGAPETYLVDAGGVIRYRHVGVVDERVWRDILQPLYQELLEERMP